MTQARAKLLQELSEVNGVPGFEAQVARVVERELKAFTEVARDNLGSIICRKEGDPKGPKVMLAAHLDEIGFMVTLVTDEGFVKFAPLGGWWDQVLLAHRVVIQTHKGEVVGFIGSKPPHLLTEEERSKVRKRQDMFIDIGAKDRKEATDGFGVRPGDAILPWSPFTRMANEKLLAGKAWDDRVGVALVVEAMKAFRGKRHPNVLYGVGTAQEEVGLRGAQTAVHTVKPDLGIVLETAIAGDVPGIELHESGVKLGGGAAIYFLEGSMIPDVRFRNFAIDVCEKEKIPHQLAFIERGGTDGGRIHIHASGVPCCIISVPTRHIHTHAGILHADDFDNSVKLLVALIQRLDAAAAKKLTSA